MSSDQSRSPLIATPHRGFCTLTVHAIPNTNHTREVVHASDSISGLIWLKDRDEVILVVQPRVPMETNENPRGMITELVAGRIDHGDMSPRAIFVAEAIEESGATITEGDIELLNGGQPMAVSPGILTELRHLALVAIGDDQLEEGTDYGVEAEGEAITRIRMSVKDFLAGPHQCLATFTMARVLEVRLLKERLAKLENKTEGQ